MLPIDLTLTLSIAVGVMLGNTFGVIAAAMIAVWQTNRDRRRAEEQIREQIRAKSSQGVVP